MIDAAKEIEMMERELFAIVRSDPSRTQEVVRTIEAFERFAPRHASKLAILKARVIRISTEAITN